jgi:hypothetical protein
MVMITLNKELIVMAGAIGGFFVLGYVYLIWNELCLEFKKRRDLRKLGKENQQQKRKDGVVRLSPK